MGTVVEAKDGGESRRSSRLSQKVMIFVVVLGICVGFSVCLELLRERVNELEAVVTRLSEVDKDSHDQGKTSFGLKKFLISYPVVLGILKLLHVLKDVFEVFTKLIDKLSIEILGLAMGIFTMNANSL